MQSAKYIIICAVMFLACGMVQRSTYTHSAGVQSEKRAESSRAAPAAVAVAGTAVKTPEGFEARSKKLEEAYRDWQGIPYILGGKSYSGVDCSSFMQIVFEDYFGVFLPRNTREQMGSGKLVKRKHIRIGDLIFFNTGRRTLHVGVALNERQFLHASTTAGVTISSIEDKYWDKAYLTTRRVL